MSSQILDGGHTAPTPPHAGLRRLSLSLDEDQPGKLTGFKKLIATIDMPNNTGMPLRTEVIFARAKEVVSNIASIIALSTGRPIQVKPVTAKQRLAPQPPTYRFVTGDPEWVELAPPVPLDAVLLGVSMTDTQRRIANWWSRGVCQRDPVDQLIALNSALDLLANMRKGEPTSTRDRVRLFLTEAGIDEKTADAVWKSRNALSHGSSYLTEEELRVYATYAALLARAIRSELAAQLDVSLPPMPAFPFEARSAVIDVEYVEPEQTASALGN